MPSLTTATGLKCPHCRHEMVVVTRGLLWGWWRQIWRHLQIKAARQRGGRVKCGVCGRTWIERGDRRKYLALTKEQRLKLAELSKRRRKGMA